MHNVLRSRGGAKACHNVLYRMNEEAVPIVQLSRALYMGYTRRLTTIVDGRVADKAKLWIVKSVVYVTICCST
jgi:hypothetical protein